MYNTSHAGFSVKISNNARAFKILLGKIIYLPFKLTRLFINERLLSFFFFHRRISSWFLTLYGVPKCAHKID